MALLVPRISKPQRSISFLLLLAFSLNAFGTGISPAKIAEAVGSTYVVSTLNDSGAGSLRQAIQNANSNLGEDTITSTIAGTITLSSDLPALTEGVTLDFTSTTQEGPNLLIDAAATTYGLQIKASNVTLYGLGVKNATIGLDLDSSASNTTIGGSGSEAGFSSRGNSVSGVHINGASNVTLTHSEIYSNEIGVNIESGTSIRINGSGARNAIYGNSSNGIYVQGGSNLSIDSTNVGLDASGSANGNGGNGIQVEAAASNVQIGSTSLASRNVVSSNNDYGIFVLANGVSILGNYIGTSLDGESASGNGSVGLEVASSNNQIKNNLISGNTYGIILYGTESQTANTNILENNKIGTDATGTSAIPNSLSGIKIQGSNANNNRIGDSDGSNLISGNGTYGVEISGASGTSLYNNRIGTAIDGATGLQNGSYPISLDNGAQTTSIGYGVSAQKANILAAASGYTNVKINSGAGNYNQIARNTFLTGLAVNDGFSSKEGINANEAVSSPGLHFAKQIDATHVSAKVAISLQAGRVDWYIDGVWKASSNLEAQASTEVTLEGTGSYVEAIFTNTNGSSSSSSEIDISSGSQSSGGSASSSGAGSSSSPESSSSESSQTSGSSSESSNQNQTPSETPSSMAGESETPATDSSSNSNTSNPDTSSSQSSSSASSNSTNSSTTTSTNSEVSSSNSSSSLGANIHETTSKNSDKSTKSSSKTPTKTPVKTEVKTIAQVGTEILKNPKKRDGLSKTALRQSLWDSALFGSGQAGEMVQGVPSEVLRQNFGDDFKNLLDRDTDGDELTNLEEILYGSNSNLKDTDGDGLDDLDEVFATGTNPATWDSDGDWISDKTDAQALTFNSPLDRWDTKLSLEDEDGDGVINRIEALLGTDPKLSDSDTDGLSDGDEFLHYGTDASRLNSSAELEGAHLSSLQENDQVNTGFIYLMGSSTPNTLITFYDLESGDNWVPALIAKTDETGRFAGLTSIAFKEGPHTLFGVEGELLDIKQYTKPVRFTAVQARTPASGHLEESSSQETSPKLALTSRPEEMIILSWRSTIYSQTFIADGSRNTAYASPAKNLGAGSHTVAWYSVDLKTKTKSSPQQLAFSLGQAAFINNTEIPFWKILAGSLAALAAIGLINRWRKKKVQNAL